MKNKILKTVISGFTILLLAACGSDQTTSTPSNEKVQLTMNSQFATVHHIHRNVYEPFLKIVDEKTNGQVSVELHPNSALGAPDTAYDDIKNGVYDVGMITATNALNTPFFPYTIGTLPFAFPDLETAYNVLEKFEVKHPPKKANQDLYNLGPVALTEPQTIFSRTPIKSVEDLKGMKIAFQGGKGIEKLVTSWGATPVVIKGVDVYQALERGVVDASLYTVLGGMGSKIHEVGPYLLDLNIFNTPLITVMSKDVYERMPDNVKEAFDNEISGQVPTMYKGSYDSELAKAKEQLTQELEGKGGWIKLSPEEEAKIKLGAKAAWDAWIEEANKKGYDGEQLVADFKEILKEEGVELPF
ncbi:TRAP transporter substrate-binding protein [Neobacillus vireti]|uniref:TRAP transporter substrate-binding protein n=1 Tax=Neobacillus vireti TaxID=220686 RepID=UPI002FFEE7FB